MSHSFASLLTHLVFSTKERRPLIDNALEERLYPYLSGIIRELGGKLFTGNGGSDHAHLLVSLPPTEAVADVVRVIKASSSKWIHETYPGRHSFAWQRGYGAFSVSQSNTSRVGNYIDGQKKHHQKIDFREEFVRLLNRHGISADERYLWA